MTDPASSRRQSIDLMRIVAAFGIVWFHMQAPGMLPGLLALPLFLMLAGALSFRSAARETPLAFWRSRARRLLGPWLLWCLVYLAVDAWRFGPREALALDQPLSLLIGPSIHLWFLPFLLLASGLAPAARRLLPGGGRLWIAAALLGPAFALPVLPLDRGWLPDPLAQWSVALAPFAYGLIFAAGQERGAQGAALLFAGSAALTGWWGWGAPFAPFFPLAALAFEALWRLPLRHPLLPVLGGLAAGIYLAHPLVALGWYALVGGPPVAGALAVFLVTALAVWAARLALRAAPLVTAGRATAPRARARG